MSHCSLDLTTAVTLCPVCFSIFDMDGDGLLSRSELAAAIQQMQIMGEQNRSSSEAPSSTCPPDTPLSPTPLEVSLRPSPPQKASVATINSNGLEGKVLPSPVPEFAGVVMEDGMEEEEEEEEEIDEMDSSGLVSEDNLVESALERYGKAQVRTGLMWYYPPPF